MTASARNRTLLAAAWISTTTVAACVALLLARGRSLEVFYGLWVLLNAPSAVLASWFGSLVLRRFPGHGAGRILLAMGVLNALHVVAATVADVGLVAAGVDAPLVGDHGLTPALLPPRAAVPLLVMNVLWVPSAMLTVLLLAFFPDGRLRSSRWRWVPTAATIAAVLLMVGATLDAWPTADWGPDDAPLVVDLALLTGGVVTLAVVCGGIGSFVLRWRSSGQERRRFEAVGGVLVVFALLATITYPWPQVWTPLVHIALVAFLGTYGVAIARFRLHDVEPLVGKGAIATALSVLAPAAYLVIVVGLGQLVGTRASDPVLPLVAVAVVALLVEPTRRLLRRGVDRLLYGERAGRAEVLSHLAVHRGTLDATTTVDVAEMVLRATGAARVELELAYPHEPVSLVSARRDDNDDDDDEPPLAAAPVSDGDQVAGQIRIYARSAKDLLPEAAVLVEDVARLLSLLLENDRLTRVLTDQLAETRASRQRIVEAQDRARRDLERDVHDGAQARLIAARMHVGELSRRVASGREDVIPGALAGIAEEIDAAIRDLRELARGLHPPVLEQLGFPAALRAHLRDTSLPVTVTVTGEARYPRAVEGAAYFACVEAVQNALRHGDGGAIAVDVACEPTVLRLTVSDDGRGFDPATTARSGLDGISDRVTALGGVAHVRSAPGAGTRVSITLPTAPDGVQPSIAAR